MSANKNSASQSTSAQDGRRLAVLCDFDGTITRANVLESLYERFGSTQCRRATELWTENRISTQQELSLCFGTFRTTRQELESFLGSFCIDEALPGLIALCARQRWPFAIVSDGLRWYIDLILTHCGVSDIPVYANEIEFVPNGYRFRFPHFHPSSPMRGISKSAVIGTFRTMGHQVVFIGDGLSDTDALGAADWVFATGQLRDHASRSGHEVIGFHTLADVVETLGRGQLPRLKQPSQH